MSGPWAYMHGLQNMAHFFQIQIRLQDGSWVRFESGLSEQLFNWPARLLIVLGVLLFSVVLLSLIGVRSIIRPLSELRQAALLESIQADGTEANEEIEIHGQISSPYTGKPLALKRCIVNLVENAARYGGQADISVEESDSEIRISVCDSGPGIPEESLGKVFDPFFRLESSRAQHTGGTGLGLGITRNIARSHGGELILCNRAGGGLCASLTLPR